MIEHLIKRSLEALLAPPGLNILLILLGLLMLRRFYRSGLFTLLFGLCSLLVFSLPVFTQSLFALLEQHPPLSKAQLARPSAQAIVILGGGSIPGAREYHGQDALNRHALERVAYGAYLRQQTGLPILVTGGRVFHDDASEAEVMQHTLLRAFHTPTRWLEDKSRNTMENAIFSQSMLQRDRVTRIYLVTHASHMARAVNAFQQTGLEVIPAPLGFETTNKPMSYRAFLPNAHALAASSRWAHEVLGMLWYRLRY
ncbi:MAG: YdcF family protein [Gammaproteobacteria bacterium]